MSISFDQTVVCPVLVGRAPALAALERLVERTCLGRGATVLINGEAGIGKSRLVAEMVGRVQQRGTIVLEGHCFEPDGAVPYAPVVDLLSALPTDSGAVNFAEALAPVAGDLIRLVPKLAALLPASAVEQSVQGTYVAGMLGPFYKRITLPELPPGAPSPFRFAASGALGGELRQAGFRQVDERTLVLPAPWPGTPEEYWQQFYEVAVPMRPVFDSLPSEKFVQAKAEAVDLLRTHYDGRMVQTTVAMVIASGMR